MSEIKKRSIQIPLNDVSDIERIDFVDSEKRETTTALCSIHQFLRKKTIEMQNIILVHTFVL